MGKIKIVTDSTADLPLSLLNQYDIHIIPLKVIFEDQIYREGMDISVQEFYSKLAQAKQLPTTSQPSPGEFQELYEKLTEDGSSVISIHISAKMSGTLQSAQMAKSNLPDRDIRIIDSQLVTIALGLVVIAAAKAVKDDKSIDEVEKIAYEVASKVKIYFIVDSFENLQKGGRIGKATALLGTVLNIKPILTVDDGIVAPFEKIRGKGKAIERIISLLQEYAQTNTLSYLAVFHADALNDAVNLHEKLVAQIKPCENFIGDIGAVVGTHAGSGTMGIIFY